MKAAGSGEMSEWVGPPATHTSILGAQEVEVMTGLDISLWHFYGPLKNFKFVQPHQSLGIRTLSEATNPGSTSREFERGMHKLLRLQS